MLFHPMIFFEEFFPLEIITNKCTDLARRMSTVSNSKILEMTTLAMKQILKPHIGIQCRW